MRNVTILHTGGTIAFKVDYKTGGVVAKYSEKDILEMFPELKNIVKVKSKLIKNMSSEDMNFKHFNLIAKEVFRELKNSDGIIITHGTDTMHYSAAALSFILEGLDKPVIFVGAQRSSDRGSSDAGLNLICAAQFIDKSDFSGVGICMHESMSDENCLILPGVKTRKLHSSRRDAFKVVNDSAIARVNRSGKVEFLNYNKKEKGKLELRLINEKLKIGLFKSRPNMFANELKIYEKYDGLILEGTGMAGNPPINEIDEFTKEHTKISKSIKKLVDTAIKTGASVVGPVPLPTKKEVYVVNKSPFTDKDAREHFGLKIHKRLLEIVNPTNQTIDSLMHLELPAGVEVEVKM